MLIHRLLNFLVEPRDSLVQRPAQTGQGDDQPASWSDDRRIGGLGFGRLQSGQALFHFLGAAAVVLVKEGAQDFAVGLL